MRTPLSFATAETNHTMGNASFVEARPGPAAKRQALLPGSLRGQALRVAAGHWVALLVFFCGMGRLAPAYDGLAGGAAAAVVLGLVHGLLWRHLPENRPPGSMAVAPHLGAANRITLLRGFLISLTAGFLWTTPRGGPSAAAWLPGGLYLAAVVLDGLDGAWARRTRTQSLLGQVLDMRYDALGVLVAAAVAVGTHRLPAYYLAAGGAYYAFHWGLRIRRRRGKPVHPAGSRTFARLVAGFQMGFLGAALLPLFTPTVLAVAAPVFLLPLLAGFVWDWHVALGRIDEGRVRRWETRSAALADRGPLVLRGILLISGSMLLFSPTAQFFPGSKIILAGLALMVAAGFLGRTAALLMSLLLAWHASGAGVSHLLLTAMVAGLLISMTGTGTGSLWRPEDAFLLGGAGGRARYKRFPRRSHPVFTRWAAGQALALAVVAVLLYWAWRDVPLGAAAAAIGRWGGLQWMLFAALNLYVLAAMCWRWSFILRRMGHPVGFAALVGYRMGANTLSYITPGPQFGGEPLQVHGLVARHRVPADAAAASVAVDRLLELMGSLLFLSLAGLVVLPALRTESDALLPVTAAVLGVVLIVGVLLYAIAAGGRPLSRMAGKAASWIGRPSGVGGMVAFLRAGEGQAAGILTDRLWGWYVLGGLLQWSGFLAELWLIYAFLGAPLGVSGLLTVAVAARLAFLLPLPGGLGALEASQMLAVTSLGGDPALAAAACAIMRARDLVLISTGGVLAVRGMRPRQDRRPRPPRGPS